jgi:hypothetical protein
VVLSSNLLPCAGKTPSRKMLAKALDPLMATGLAGLALSIELLGLLMLAPAWHDIFKVCPAAPADVPCESCAHLAVTAAWCANILLWGTTERELAVDGCCLSGATF